MKLSAKVFRWFLFGLCLVFSQAGLAKTCQEKALSLDAFTQASELAQSVYQQLDASQAQLALIARAGSDLSQHDLTYSHIGFIQRHHPAGNWMVTHLLNRCSSSRSGLFNEGLIPFFLDEPHEYRSLVIIPTIEMQHGLLSLLNNRKAALLYEKNYNLIANPKNTKYQNSNQWVLETLAMAMAKSFMLPAERRQTAQDILHYLGYQPDYIDINIWQRFAARIATRHIHFNDHDNDTLRQGQFPVVTVRSIVRFLQENQDIIEQLEFFQDEVHQTAKLAGEPNPNQRPKNGQLPRLNQLRPIMNEQDFWR